MTRLTISTPDFAVPTGACDCHVHIFLPERFPYAAQRRYTPPRADVRDLMALRAGLEFGRTILVQPSCYGTDNAAMCAALEEMGQATTRGIAVADAQRIEDAELQRLNRLGVRGLRLNLRVQAGEHAALPALAAECQRAADRIRSLGWHLQIHVGTALLASLTPVLKSLPVPLVLDHFGGGASAGDAVAQLLKGGNTWLKLSAPYRVSGRTDHADLQAPVHQYLRIAPDRLLWASDWPHTGGDGARRASADTVEPLRQEDASANLNRLAHWVKRDDWLESILVHNPQTLYGF